MLAAIRWPLTNVPLELFRSATVQSSLVAADLGVVARDLGVVELDVVRGVAADAERALFQIEEVPWS